MGEVPYPIFPKLEVDKKGSSKEDSSAPKASSAPTAISSSPLFDFPETTDLATRREQIVQVGNRIREMKKQAKDAETRPADGNALLKKAVGELTALKERFAKKRLFPFILQIFITKTSVLSIDEMQFIRFMCMYVIFTRYKVLNNGVAYDPAVGQAK